jgi:very-short-patch-repair endonuclease
MKRNIHSDQKLKDYRKDLRNNATKEEVLLWMKLKGRKLSGYKFQRQHSIGPYVVDFYCAAKKLAIELDGHQHESNAEYDIERTNYLNNFGVTVIRFSNEEVSFSIISVVDSINRSLAG